MANRRLHSKGKKRKALVTHRRLELFIDQIIIIIKYIFFSSIEVLTKRHLPLLSPRL
jgi:hypothetical protein